MVIARTAARASTGIRQDKPLSPSACPAARGSTGWEQEDPVKRLVRTAARAGTGWEQEDPLNHRALPVLRTRTRLLRAVLKPPALATRATVATSAQGIAQCA